MSAAISEIIGYTVSGCMIERFGIRKSSFISSTLAASGGILILFFGLEHQDSLIFPLLFLISKIGQSCCFNISYACISKLFEVKRATRVLGVANFFGRGVSAFAPLISTLDLPIPIGLFCLTTILSGLISCFFKEPPSCNSAAKSSEQRKI